MSEYISVPEMLRNQASGLRAKASASRQEAEMHSALANGCEKSASADEERAAELEVAASALEQTC